MRPVLCAWASGLLLASLVASAADVEIRIRSDYEAGTRAHAAGNLEMAIIFFKQGAEKGDPKSQFALGTHYYFGEGVDQDLAKARALFEASAEQGNAESAYVLGLMHSRGEGVPADDSKALTYYTRAAYGCLGEAQSAVAQALYEGIGGPADKLDGIAWLSIAADTARDLDTLGVVEEIRGSLSEAERRSVDERVTSHRANMSCDARDEAGR